MRGHANPAMTGQRTDSSLSEITQQYPDTCHQDTMSHFTVYKKTQNSL